MDDKQTNTALEIHEKEYANEAKEKWGNTVAYAESQERVSKLSKEELKKVLAEQGDISFLMAQCMKDGLDAKNPKVQELVERHYNWLRNFYEPNSELYVGLAEMYVSDPRFRNNYEDVASGLAKFFGDAMIVYVQSNN